MGIQGKSSLQYILEALIPYTDANMKLAFKPHLFFNDLERISRYKKQTLRNRYYTAKQHGYFDINKQNGKVRLSQKGIIQLKRYNPQKLGDGARILLVFDVPEVNSWGRKQLRALLRELRFRQVQQSVWETEYDQREYLQQEIVRLGLEDNIIIYEALPLTSFAEE